MDYKFESYVPRTQKFFKVHKKHDWAIKIYGINLSESPKDEQLDSFLSKLPSPAKNEHRYGVGFLIIHKGKIANWFLLNWWGHEDIIHQELFRSPLNDFEAVASVQDKSIMACIHELEIYYREIEAWKKFVLGQNKPDFEGYLYNFNT